MGGGELDALGFGGIHVGGSFCGGVLRSEGLEGEGEGDSLPGAEGLRTGHRELKLEHGDVELAVILKDGCGERRVAQVDAQALARRQHPREPLDRARVELVWLDEGLGERFLLQLSTVVGEPMAAGSSVSGQEKLEVGALAGEVGGGREGVGDAEALSEGLGGLFEGYRAHVGGE